MPDILEDIEQETKNLDSPRNTGSMQFDSKFLNESCQTFSKLNIDIVNEKVTSMLILDSKTNLD